MTKQEQRLSEGYIVQCAECDKVLDQQQYCTCDLCDVVLCTGECANIHCVNDHASRIDADYTVVDTREPEDLPDMAFDCDNFADLGGIGCEPR